MLTTFEVLKHFIIGFLGRLLTPSNNQTTRHYNDLW